MPAKGTKVGVRLNTRMLAQKQPFIKSEEVQLRKGRKERPGGVKQNLKPYVYKQTKHVKVRCRTFCRTVRRVILYGKVKY